VLDVSGAVFDVSRGAMALKELLIRRVPIATSISMFWLTSNTHFGLWGCDVLNLVDMRRSGPRSIGAADGLIILHPITLIASITDDIQRNSFAFGNLSLLAPYFGLFL
jgi:hypothetical protein